MPKRMVVTGGCGFIASHLIQYLLQITDTEIVIMDKFSYASSGVRRLKEIGAYDNPRVQLQVVDISQPISKCMIKDIGHVDYIVHLAAGSHVDRSIACPREFIQDNFLGTFEMLEYARQLPNLKYFNYFSTDEVFGPADEGQKFLEWDRYDSRSPYAATKAGGEELSLAWANTYDVPVIVTHCQNVIGERQHFEKFVPRVVRAALDGTKIFVHTDPKTGRSGSRNYFHARDVAMAVQFLLDIEAPVREKYNIAGDQEISNLNVVHSVQDILGVAIDHEQVNPTDVRPGFDVRYGLSGEKMAKLGWKAPHNFHQRLEDLVLWMTDEKNRHWLYS